MNDKPDPVAVARKASELSAELGLGAHRHARTRAKEADAAGNTTEAAFWTAVADALSPRCSI